MESLVLILFLLFIAGSILVLMFQVSDGFNIWYKTTFKGYTRIQLYDGEHSFNEAFQTIVMFDDVGEIISPVYRYNCHNIGNVRLNKNGTANYCGSYKWKRA